MTTKNLAIVGGGPAGAYLAYLLAKEGIEVTIFDDSHPREKPCGGGISPKALERFPILRKIPHPKRPMSTVDLISPNGVEITTSGTHGMNISRLHLDKYLLDKAVDEGAELIEERVTDVEQESDGWVLKTKQSTLKTKTVIGADGTKSIVRNKLIGPITSNNLAITTGYFAKGAERDRNLIRFIKDGYGYIWAFPREDHTSIGIIMDFEHSKGLPNELDKFIKLRYKNISVLNRWSALIPQVKDVNFYKIPCAGENWILTGDAAGHVDPVTGEGICYALWSADVAYKAIINENPILFNTLWLEEYGKDFIWGTRLAGLFHHPAFLEFSLKMGLKSKTYAQIMHDLLANEQDYSGVIQRVVLDIPNIAFDLFWRKSRDGD